MGFDGREPGQMPALDEIERLRAELAAAKDDYARRHKDATDRYEEIIALRAELAAEREKLAKALEALANAEDVLETFAKGVDRFKATKLINPKISDFEAIPLTATKGQVLDAFRIIEAIKQQRIDALLNGGGDE